MPRNLETVVAVLYIERCLDKKQTRGCMDKGAYSRCDEIKYMDTG